MSRSRSTQLYFASSFRSNSMSHRTPSNTSSQDKDPKTIDTFSQKPKRYRGNILFPPNQLSQNNNNRKKKQQADYPSSSSEQQRIVSQIQRWKGQYTIQLQELKQVLNRINRYRQQRQELSSEILDVLSKGEFQTLKWLYNKQQKVERILKQQTNTKLNVQNHLWKLRQNIKQLQNKLPQYRLKKILHKRLPRVK